MKRALLAATAIITSSFAAVPAYAGIDDDIPLDSVIGELGQTPQQICDDLLRPNNPNSKFFTYPGNESGETLLSSSDPVRDSEPFDQTPNGDPTYSDYGNFDTNYHRNGGSPNVWTGADANVANYASSDLHYHTTITDTYGETFDCVVEKNPGGTEHGPDAIFPPGLQSYGNTAITRTEDRAGDDETDVGAGGPMSIPGDYYDGNVLICISPNNTTKGKPGTWTKKHGFTGDCAAASAAAGGTVPSGNAP